MPQNYRIIGSTGCAVAQRAGSNKRDPRDDDKAWQQAAADDRAECRACRARSQSAGRRRFLGNWRVFEDFTAKN